MDVKTLIAFLELYKDENLKVKLASDAEGNEIREIDEVAYAEDTPEGKIVIIWPVH